MTANNIWIFVKTILDILLVWIIFYYILKNLKNNVKMLILFKGIAIIVGIKLVSDWLNLITIGLLLEFVIMWGPLALIIIFQPEIRNVLEHLGRSQLLGRHKVLTFDEREKVVYEIMEAVEQLKRARIGALIVIERDISLSDYIEKSKKIYADISNELLVSIFFPNNPLHDGGVIIQGDRITSAGAVFPTSSNPNISKRLGTRHRAGIGISEETDAIIVIVSEETGRVSIAIEGKLTYNLSLDNTKMMLIDELKPKNDILHKEEEEIEKEEENGNN